MPCRLADAAMLKSTDVTRLSGLASCEQTAWI
jgi:hypothetical protein